MVLRGPTHSTTLTDLSNMPRLSLVLYEQRQSIRYAQCAFTCCAAFHSLLVSISFFFLGSLVITIPKASFLQFRPTHKLYSIHESISTDITLRHSSLPQLHLGWPGLVLTGEHCKLDESKPRALTRTSLATLWTALQGRKQSHVGSSGHSRKPAPVNSLGPLFLRTYCSRLVFFSSFI